MSMATSHYPRSNSGRGGCTGETLRRPVPDAKRNGALGHDVAARHLGQLHAARQTPEKARQLPAVLPGRAPDAQQARRDRALPLLAAERPQDALEHLKCHGPALMDDPRYRLYLVAVLREVGRAKHTKDLL